MRYVIIDQTSIVINVILWDGTAGWTPPQGCTAIKSDTLQIGDTYIKGK